MTPPWKTYRVNFSVRDCYTIDVKARSEAEAEHKAHAIYEAHGESVAHGIHFDISDGGAEGREAAEVVS
ncbi:MAG TPA: hypothetical protein PLF37_15715 [Planctomycetota bacterium]|nr:hypothetical protein [Planctomycetota bacterium]